MIVIIIIIIANDNPVYNVPTHAYTPIKIYLLYSMEEKGRAGAMQHAVGDSMQRQ